MTRSVCPCWQRVWLQPAQNHAAADRAVPAGGQCVRGELGLLKMQRSQSCWETGQAWGPKQRSCGHSHWCFRGQNQAAGYLAPHSCSPDEVHQLHDANAIKLHFFFNKQNHTENCLKTYYFKLFIYFWCSRNALVCWGESIALPAISLIKCLGKQLPRPVPLTSTLTAYAEVGHLKNTLCVFI